MRSKIQKFFSENEKTLTRLHPGLTLHTLTRELEWLNDLHGQKLNPSEIFHELLSGKPLAYCIGYQYFYDAFYQVAPCTLIPRPESELIVARALELIKKENIRFADIGTGTGAIGLAIARQLQKCEAVLTDISLDVLNLAKRNYFFQGHLFSQQKVEFVQSDRMTSVSGEFDLIVSNPPYIKRNADWEQVSEQVRNFEPELALFLPDDEYTAWFSTFFKQIDQHLAPNGHFLMEGHEAHLDDLAKLMGALDIFSEIRVCADLTGRPRFIESKKNG